MKERASAAWWCFDGKETEEDDQESGRLEDMLAWPQVPRPAPLPDLLARRREEEKVALMEAGETCLASSPILAALPKIQSGD
jgi:hypothetical protein